MQITDFKTQFDPLFLSYIQERTRAYASYHPLTARVFEQLALVAQGGKRFRPYVVYRTYTATYPETTVADLSPLLIAIELLHLFCLIHDDVMDQAEVRHDKQTIQYFLALERKETVGHIDESIAILVGDMVFNWMYMSLFQQKYHDPVVATTVVEVWNRLVDEVCVGQMVDVVYTYPNNPTPTKAEIDQKNMLKTSLYSFARPVELGLVSSGKEEYRTQSVEIMSLIGLLFQMQDDLFDIEPNQKTGKTIYKDITSGQPTYVSLFVGEHATAEDLAYLEALRGKTLSDLDQKHIASIHQSVSVQSHMTQMITEQYTRVVHAIQASSLSQIYKDIYIETLEYVYNRTS